MHWQADHFTRERLGHRKRLARISGRVGRLLVKRQRVMHRARNAARFEFPLETGAGKNRFIATDSTFLKAARSRGISFGD